MPTPADSAQGPLHVGATHTKNATSSFLLYQQGESRAARQDWRLLSRKDRQAQFNKVPTEDKELRPPPSTHTHTFDFTAENTFATESDIMLQYSTSFSAAKVPSAGEWVIPILRGLSRSSDTQPAWTADTPTFNKVHYEMCQFSSETGQAHKRPLGQLPSEEAWTETLTGPIRAMTRTERGGLRAHGTLRCLQYHSIPQQPPVQSRPSWLHCKTSALKRLVITFRWSIGP